MSEEYKLPEGWEWIELENLCEKKIQSGGTPLSSEKKYYEGGTIPWVITADMTKAGKKISQTIKKITQMGLDNSNVKIFPKDTLLFSMYGSIGKMSITKIEMGSNQAILGIIVDKNKVLLNYLYYNLEFFKAGLIMKARGGTQANINAKMVKEYEVPIPFPNHPEKSLEIQQKIVDKLDLFFQHYETLKEEKQKAVENYDDILAATISKLIPSNEEELPEGWEEKKLGLLSEFVMGQAPPKDSCNREGKGEIFVKVKEFGKLYPKKENWTTYPLKFALEGDILICVVGATIGKLNLGVKCSIGRSVAAIRPHSNILQKYLYYYLIPEVKKIRLKSNGTAQGVISKPFLNKLPIGIPFPNDPEKSLKIQREIVEEIEKAKAIQDKINEEKEFIQKQLEDLPKSVLAKAFRGELI